MIFGYTLVEALSTCADALRGQGLDERPEVRRALHRVDGRILQIRAKQEVVRRNLAQLTECVRCPEKVPGTLTCRACRSFLPWELRQAFVRAEDGAEREQVRQEALGWLARPRGARVVAGKKGGKRS